MHVLRIVSSFLCSAIAWADSNQDESLQSLDMSPITSEMWGVPPAHKYNQIFDITPHNYESTIMDSDDVWIVVFYKSSFSKKWQEVATKYGGALLFGSVDVAKYPKLSRSLKVKRTSLDETKDVAVIFPLKSEDKYAALDDGTMKTTSDPRKALKHASRYIPDKTTDLTFSADQMQIFNDWVMKGYYNEQPPKFPIICLVDVEETPIHIKSTAHYFATHFSFGVVRKVNVPAMRRAFQQVPDPESYPTYLVLLGIEPTSEQMNSGSYEMRFNIMPYIEPKYGNPRLLSSLVNFLFVANSDYRNRLPGREPGEPEYVSNMEDIRKKLTKRVPSDEEHSSKQSKSEL